MRTSKLCFRQATQADVEKISPWEGNPSIKAWVAEIDGDLVGLGGLLYVRGRWMAFYSPTDALRPHKIAVARAAKRFFAQQRKDGVKFIYAERDLDEPAAGRWLESLGFEIDPKSRYFYRWRS